jgi:hypothetical protein
MRWAALILPLVIGLPALEAQDVPEMSDFDVFVVMELAPIDVATPPDTELQPFRAPVREDRSDLQWVPVRTSRGAKNTFHVTLNEDAVDSNVVARWVKLNSAMRVIRDIGAPSSVQSGPRSTRLTWNKIAMESDLLGLVELQLFSEAGTLLGRSTLLASDAVVSIGLPVRSDGASRQDFRTDAYDARDARSIGVGGDTFDAALHIFGFSSAPTEGLPADAEVQIHLRAPTDFVLELPETYRDEDAQEHVLQFVVKSEELALRVGSGIPFSIHTRSSDRAIRREWIRATVKILDVERLKSELMAQEERN